MSKKSSFAVIFMVIFLCASHLPAKSPYAKLQPVDFTDVHWTGGFWADKFDVIKKTAVPNMWNILEDPDISHAYTNFLVAAGMEEGVFSGTWWHDGDFYKWIEAASYVYAVTKDEKLNLLLDKAIETISKVQRENGYIHTAVLIGHGIRTYRTGDVSFEGKTEAWQNSGDHEVYNLGHLITAACVHHKATGKTNFLDIAVKAADHLHAVFREPSPSLSLLVGNPPHIMGLVELYRTTGEKKYLDLAGVFVDMRGMSEEGKDGNQNRVPFRDAKEAVGHAVLGTYLYCGVADVYAETGEKALWDALLQLSENVRTQKMYITGAVGALHSGISSSGDRVGEAYGREYQLPSTSAYNETCANIANAMWHWRLFNISSEPEFADIMELVLYNSALSGLSLDGKNFFYTNVLRRTKDAPLLSWDLPTRQPYLSCFCCPSNIVRTVAKVHGWAYSRSEKGIWINLYGGNVLETERIGGSRIKLIQETNYPWDGKITIVVDSPKKDEYSMMLRIPEWAQNANLTVNGHPVTAPIQPGTYHELHRSWQKGDVVELNLPMEVQLICANPLVEELRNQVAVKRGPVVYCLESPDLPEDVNVRQVFIPVDVQLQPRYKDDLLGGVAVLEGQAIYVPEGEWTDGLYLAREVKEKKFITVQLIPYFAWSNRGVTEMTVWMPVSRSR